LQSDRNKQYKHLEWGTWNIRFINWRFKFGGITQIGANEIPSSEVCVKNYISWWKAMLQYYAYAHYGHKYEKIKGLF
jgi:hypothetical protein